MAATSVIPQPAPLPDTFSKEQANKAVNALLAHYKKHKEEAEKTQLMTRQEHIWLVVNTKQMPKKRSLKPIPIRLPLPPLPPPPATSVCLISKDPQREYKDLLAKHDIKFVNRVVGITKLKGKHAPYEARRQLKNDHDIFLCDDRVMPMLPKLLGSKFFDAKKQPISVNLSRKDLKGELGRAISSTYFHESLGTCTTVKIATPIHHNPDQILSNLFAAIPSVVSKIQGGFENIQSLGIKTSGSAMLPIWMGGLEGRFDLPKKAEGNPEKKGEKGKTVVRNGGGVKEMTAEGEEGLDDEDEEMEDEGYESESEEEEIIRKPTEKKGKSSIGKPDTKLQSKPTKALIPSASDKKAGPKEPKKVVAGKEKAEVPPKKKVAPSSAGLKKSGKTQIIGKKSSKVRA